MGRTANRVDDFIDVQTLGDADIAQLIFNEVLLTGSEDEGSHVDSLSEDDERHSGFAVGSDNLSDDRSNSVTNNADRGDSPREDEAIAMDVDYDERHYSNDGGDSSSAEVSDGNQ